MEPNIEAEAERTLNQIRTLVEKAEKVARSSSSEKATSELAELLRNIRRTTDSGTDIVNNYEGGRVQYEGIFKSVSNDLHDGDRTSTEWADRLARCREVIDPEARK